MENSINLQELLIVKDTAPEMAEMIIDVCKFNVDEMCKSLEHPSNVNNKFVLDLDSKQRTEMLDFYRSILTIFSEFELYEYCSKLLIIIDSLDISEEKVGSLQKNSD